MEEKDRYEEFKVLRPFLGWLLLVLFSALILTAAMVVHMMVADRPREWDFGSLPDTPAESIYSTGEPGLTARPERQIEPLPEAKPLKTQRPEDEL